MSKKVGLGILGGLCAGLLITVLVGFVYRPLLVAGPDSAYPWGAQTWGHLLKTVSLSRQASSGDLYPALMAWWSGGSEPFRQASPAAYYLLALLTSLTGSVFVAGARLIPLAAAIGGLSWLLFSRRLGWVGATAAGLAWTIWPEHVRVAMAEGDLPRVVATALLPLLLWTFLAALEQNWWPWSGLSFIVVLHLTVVSEVLTALITAGALVLLGLVLRLVSGARVRDVLRALSLVVLGLLSAAWWLLPALPGWSAVVDAPAGASAPILQAHWVTANPLFYWGMASAALLALVLLSLRRRGPLGQALLLCAGLGFALSIPEAGQAVSRVLPAALIEPTRLAALAPLAVFVSFLSWKRAANGSETEPPPRGRRVPLTPVLAIILVLVVFGEAQCLFELIRTGRPSADLEELSRTLLLRRPAGRIAVLDRGDLGSEPSFVLTLPGWREQVFGSFWTTAPAAPVLSLINTGLERHAYAYVVDRTVQMAASDLVVLRDRVRVTPFDEAATGAGFSGPEDYGRLLLYSRRSSPQAFLSPYPVLAVGSMAGDASLLFPAVETGGPGEIDRYDRETLAGYDALLLAGASWRSRERAEELLRTYVRQGGRLVIDLTGRQETLFDGEPVWWEGGLVGVKTVDNRDVWFTAAGLTHRALLEGSTEDLAILADLIDLEPGVMPDRRALTLHSYETTGSGYSFEIDIPADWRGGRLVLPIGAGPSLAVRLDGREVPTWPVEGLLSLEAVPGRHSVTVDVTRPALALLGTIVSGWTLLLALAYTGVQLTRSRRRGSRGPRASGRRPGGRHTRHRGKADV